MHPSVTGALLVAWSLGITAGDPGSAWQAVGRPTQGVHDSEEWVLSCFSRPAESGSASFVDVELAECKQEATIAMVAHCAGPASVPGSVPTALRRTIQDALDGWLAWRVHAGGVVWVRSNRSDGVDLVVMAMPTETCRSMPHGLEWIASMPEIAAWTSGWQVPAALLEACEERDRASVAAIVSERMTSAFERGESGWPAGFVKLPEGLPADAAARLTLDDLAAVAALRPGDSTLWSMVGDRCEAMQMRQAARLARELPEFRRWLGASPPPGRAWSRVETGELPPHLVAVVRSGGGIVCRAQPGGGASREAQAAYASTPPDLRTAEAKAREACVVPDPDALNLLAALRLNDSRATPAMLSQALAFAWQARVIVADHPYATANVLRAMQRLEMAKEAGALLRALPEAPRGSWARREIDKVAAWLEQSGADAVAPPR